MVGRLDDLRAELTLRSPPSRPPGRAEVSSLGAARRAAAALVTLATTGACAGADTPTARPPAAPATATAPTAAAAPVGVVDSILPMPELLRRFRADLGADPGRLTGGASSRAALVRRFADAVAAEDTATLRELTVSRREFAYLVYPTHPLARPPYALPPALLWFQIGEGSQKGITRLLRRHGGRPLGIVGHACEAEPERQGENRVWARCTVRQVRGPGDTVTARLFGSVLARGGVFKFVGYANDL